MPYTSNPYVARTRRLAVNDVLVRHFTNSFVSRKYGVHRSTIGRWLKRATGDRKTYIETESSRPHHHPRQLPKELEAKVIKVRLETGRCAQILYAMLKNKGVVVSLSSVKRVLKRNRLTRRKRQLKPPYAKVQRPEAKMPGDLVEMDTIHFVKFDGSRFYIYALIDVCSRYGYAEYSKYLSARKSASVAYNALKTFRFKVLTIQTDNGGEFSEAFYFSLKKIGIQLRHTRPRKPNDNAHIERFVRTIQEEGFGWRLPEEQTMQNSLQKYMSYYNKERLHLGINCNTPCSIVAKLLS
jgi:transposase InsO family protein